MAAPKTPTWAASLGDVELDRVFASIDGGEDRGRVESVKREALGVLLQATKRRLAGRSKPCPVPQPRRP